MVVSRFGIGVDNIPVERATELGILVTNVPAFCIDEVSDHTMALLLACSRHVVPLANAVRRGAWRLDPARGQHRMRGQTLGIVGFGAIARSLVPKAAGFGLKLLAYTPRLDSASLPAGVERAATLDELLLASDFVTPSTRAATSATRGLIGERELPLMKPSAYLINTSRGALVDEAALNRAIAEGWVAGAALDVLAAEPPTPGNPLLAVDGVLVTPHTAFYSEEAVVDLETRAAANVAAVLSGRLPGDRERRCPRPPDLRFRAGMRREGRHLRAQPSTRPAVLGGRTRPARTASSACRPS